MSGSLGSNATLQVNMVTYVRRQVSDPADEWRCANLIKKPFRSSIVRNKSCIKKPWENCWDLQKEGLFVARLGFEPKHSEPESDVLPLYYRAERIKNKEQ
jgi:hypothetical protein